MTTGSEKDLENAQALVPVCFAVVKFSGSHLLQMAYGGAEGQFVDISETGLKNRAVQADF